MAEYPSEYELDVVLRDGGGARVRPIKPEDATPDPSSSSRRLGPESRYFRFFRIKETLEPKEVEFFTKVDYSDRMALIALLDGRMIAVARYDRERTRTATAEVAFAVADKHQGRGIGHPTPPAADQPRPLSWHRAVSRLRAPREPPDDEAVPQLGVRADPHHRRGGVHRRLPGRRERWDARGRGGAREAGRGRLPTAALLPAVGRCDRRLQ